MEKDRQLEAYRVAVVKDAHRRFAMILENEGREFTVFTPHGAMTVRGFEGFDGTNPQVEMQASDGTLRRGRSYGISIDDRSMGLRTSVHYAIFDKDIVPGRIFVSGMENEDEGEVLSVARREIEKAGPSTEKSNTL